MASRVSDAGVGEQVFDKAKTIGNDFVDIGRIVRDAVAEKFQELGQGALNKAQNGYERATELKDGAALAIEKRPLTAVLIAAAIGMLIGFFGRRR